LNAAFLPPPVTVSRDAAEAAVGPTYCAMNAWVSRHGGRLVIE
jgi:hypothetical protein